MVRGIRRRGKYLLLDVGQGTLLMHLGMSGSLRVVTSDIPRLRHDHVEFETDLSKLIRLNDPRRFGAILWTQDNVQDHPLIAHLGPEPLSDAFTADYLYARSRRRTQPIKQFLMDARTVVGVGNIYANEALYLAKVLPLRSAGRVSRARYQVLVDAVRQVLGDAIAQGGTTLRDFVASDGRPGYFKQQLLAYGRGGLPCQECGNSLTEVRLGQRSTVYCRHCQH